ncbi:MAG: GNAT family N-acetyltransferase [Trueperaceae bacterium]
MIRSATLSDARAIAEVHVKSWQSAYRGLLSEDFLENLSVDRREEIWRNGIQNSQQVVLVYEQEKRVMAFCSFASSRDDDVDQTKVAELFTMYALESVWGQGIGEALWHEATKQMRERGFTEIMLWVLKGNKRAIKFYERQGLVFDGTTKTEAVTATLDLHELRYHKQL